MGCSSEMLKDGPSLNDLSSTVQGGTVNVDGKPQAYIRPDNQSQRANNMPGQANVPRSPSVPTMPPGELAPHYLLHFISFVFIFVGVAVVEDLLLF